MEQVIYKIVNLVNDKFYVGSTTNKRERFRTHRNRLRRGVHHAPHLQAAWNKYGEEKFDFRVVEHVPEGQSLREAEDLWLEKHVGKDYCYNKSRYSDTPMRGIPKEMHPSFGKPKTEEQRAAISASLKEFYAKDYFNHPRVGTFHSEETKARIREAKKANPSKYWQGKTRDEETRKKISEAQKGVAKPERKVSEEGLAKIHANIEAGRSHKHWVGRKHSEESKAKLSKPVQEVTSGRVFRSLTEALVELDLKMPTLRRALVSGQPLTRGPRKGLQFRYVDSAARPSAAFGGS